MEVFTVLFISRPFLYSLLWDEILPKVAKDQPVCYLSNI